MVKEDYIPIKSKISNGPKKGDLIVTHGNHWKNKITHFFTNYHESHVSIVTKGGKNAKVMQSNDKGTYEESLIYYIENYDGLVGYRPLTKEARKKFNKRIKVFDEIIEHRKKNSAPFDLKETIKLGIFHKPFEKVLKIEGVNDTKSREKLFCSQFIAFIYQEVGLFPKNILPHLLSPGAVAKGLCVFKTTEKETIWLNKLKSEK